MKVIAPNTNTIPRCPPMPQFDPLIMFGKRVNAMGTKELKALVAKLTERLADAGANAPDRLKKKLEIAKKELKSRQPDAEYKAKLRKMSDAELRNEYSNAQKQLWCAEHGFAYIPEQVEAAQHRIELIQAEASRRGISLPRELPFVR